jgi:hypothetical protein
VSPRTVSRRFADALRAGWRAALVRWREAPPVAARKRTSWFDCAPDTLPLPRGAEDAEAEAREWYASHFKNWPGQRR